jgi:hypothetical protein
VTKVDQISQGRAEAKAAARRRSSQTIAEKEEPEGAPSASRIIVATIQTSLHNNKTNELKPYCYRLTQNLYESFVFPLNCLALSKFREYIVRYSNISALNLTKAK